MELNRGKPILHHPVKITTFLWHVFLQEKPYSLHTQEEFTGITCTLPDLKVDRTSMQLLSLTTQTEIIFPIFHADLQNGRHIFVQCQ